MRIYYPLSAGRKDKDKFGNIYRKYRYLMIHVANRTLNCHHDAQDDVHHAFIAIMKNSEKFSVFGNPKTHSLIVLIAERKAIDILRKRQREKLPEINEETLCVEAQEPDSRSLADAMARLAAKGYSCAMFKV